MNTHIPTQKVNVTFKEGSFQKTLYEKIILNGTSEEDVAKELNEPLNKIHYYTLAVKRKIKKEQEKFEKTFKQIADNNTNEVNQHDLENMTQFIPRSDGYISRKIGKFQDIKILEKCYNDRAFVLIFGETGTGKTHLVRHFAYEKKLPYARVNLNGGTTADELIGHWVPKEDGGFKWQDGILTLFARYGGVVVLDEVNSCPAEILFALHSLTDDERTLTLTAKDGEVVHSHKNFFLVATMNPDYEGTKPLNAAFKDRFKVKLFFDYDTKIEKQLINEDNLVEIARKLRVMKAKGEINTPISTRMLMYFKSNEELFDTKFAIELFLNNFEAYEREAIKNVVEMMANKGSKSSLNMVEREVEFHTV